MGAAAPPELTTFAAPTVRPAGPNVGAVCRYPGGQRPGISGPAMCPDCVAAACAEMPVPKKPRHASERPWLGEALPARAAARGLHCILRLNRGSTGRREGGKGEKAHFLF